MEKRKSKNQVNLESLKIIIGDSLYDEVIKVMSGVTLYLSEDNNSRDDEIRQMYYDNVPVETIAKKYNLTVSRIYQIVEKVH